MAVKWRIVDGTIHVRKSTTTGGTNVDIQAAVDEALASGSRIRRVRIPAGDWQISAPISLSPASPSAPTLGLELVGERPAFATGDLTRFTNLRATFNNQPIVQASLTRGLSVANMVLWGTNAISANFASLDSLLLDSVWLAPGVTANHVGIALDNDIPVNGGSSAWTIRNVYFRDLARGLTVGAHANAQNGSEGTVDSCVFDFCGEAGYAPGHTQTKAVTFLSCFWNGCKRIVDGRLVGQLAGWSPTIVGGGVTLCQRLVELNQSPLNCSLNNVESTYGIGTLGSGFSLASRPSVFHGTQFDFWWPSAAGKHIGAHIYTFNQLEFSSCIFSHAGSNNPATLRVHNPNANVTFANCWFDSKADNGRLPIDGNDPTRVRFGSCEYQDGVSKLNLHGTGSHSNLSLGGGTLVLTGPGVATLTIAGIGAADIGVGDLLAPSVAWTPKNRAANNPSTLSIGEVVSKVGDTVTINGVPEEIEASPPAAQEWFRRRLIVA